MGHVIFLGILVFAVALGLGACGASGDNPEPMGAAFSPDGSRVAFTSRAADGNGIFVVNVDGSGLTNLTNSPGDDWLLSWSPR